jgi:hypothetical protein
VRGVVLKSFQYSNDLRIKVESIANVLFKGVVVIGSYPGGRKKEIWFKNDLILVVVGVCDKVSRNMG